MTERYLHDEFDVTEYAFNRLSDTDRELLTKFDEYCFRKLGEEGLDFNPEAAKHIEEEGYLAVPGSKEVVEKWDMFIAEGIKIANAKYN